MIIYLYICKPISSYKPCNGPSPCWPTATACSSSIFRLRPRGHQVGSPSHHLQPWRRWPAVDPSCVVVQQVAAARFVVLHRQRLWRNPANLAALAITLPLAYGTFAGAIRERVCRSCRNWESLRKVFSFFYCLSAACYWRYRSPCWRRPNNFACM